MKFKEPLIVLCAICIPVRGQEDAGKLRGEIAEIQQLRATIEQKEKSLRDQLRSLQIPLDTTKGVGNVCPIHKVKMQVRRVPIVYGLLVQRPTDPPIDVMRAQFPFAFDYWRGGCIVQGKSMALIYICPECQRAEERWIHHPTRSQR